MCNLPIGIEFHLTPPQAHCLRLLHEAYLRGTPELRGDFLLEEAESKSSKMSDVFKRSPAWKTLIVQGERKGAYRLDLSPKVSLKSP